MTDEVRAHVRELLAHLTRPVRLVFFTSKHACGACVEQRALLDDLVQLRGDKLTLEVRELVADAAEAQRLGIDKVPATAVLGDRDRGLRFYGLTGGYELASLLEAIQMVSTDDAGLDPEVAALARELAVPVHLEVMVTLTCPYCQRMVRLAHQLAFANDHVRADMVDAAEFPTLTGRYRVRGVPRTVVNGRDGFDGALSPAAAVLEILKLADPDAYERVDAALRQARGERKATEATPEREYDVIVVGAGPAGLSAALYAARKGRAVALIGKQVGGQINDTATIENYLGVTEVGGRELATAFKHHVEAYAVAERGHTLARTIRHDGRRFEVVTDDGLTYRGRSVIYAAGKQYRRLGVPGEDRFLGRGVAFCATCDAPLYRDKRVAVVGGGNSAFTAARDLVGFARDVHLVHALPDFQADPVLVEEVVRAPNVTVHRETTVRGFLGDDQLTGIRVEVAHGQDGFDLAVDGVFLEIGLVPNTGPVRELLALNASGEIPIRRDQSTTIDGLFAAGDVTDEPDKQIIIAAGDGARAALAVDRYLSRSRGGS